MSRGILGLTAIIFSLCVEEVIAGRRVRRRKEEVTASVQTNVTEGSKRDGDDFVM
jgi:hypothetical protein